MIRVAYDARHAARGLGISTFLVQLAVELVARDDIELVWLGDSGLAPEGARTVPLDRLPYPMLDGPLGRRIVGRLGVDLVHFTGNTGWGRRGPVPALLTLHDLIFTSSSSQRSLRQTVGHRYERRNVRRALSAAAAVAVPSGTVARAVTERYGEAINPQIVYEGVRLRDGQPVPRVGGADAPYLLAFAGRDPRKRTASVVEGWRSIAATGVELRLLASAGISRELHGTLEPELRRGTVTVFDHLPRRELCAQIEGALALAYPSSDEGFGLPVLEAMASGTPVLTGLAPVTREIGADAIVALDAHDIAGSIATGVRRLLDDRRYASEIARRGRTRAAGFSWRATADRYAELYASVMERSAG